MATQLENIKWVPHTKFIVDGFNFVSPTCQHYFLTHMHSDHTTGLPRRFTAGLIYTSPLTAKLLMHDFGLKDVHKVVRPLPLNVKHVIEGVGVTLLDANHCPGAVMILFEVPQPSGGSLRILHTGDMRWQPRLAEAGALKTARVDMLFLDTTYCYPRYSFPPQDDVIETMAQLCKQCAEEHPGLLCLVGSYHIGKERAFFGVAIRLGWRIWAAPTKRKLLDLLPLTPDEAAALTSDPDSAHIHVGFMGAELRMEALQQRLQSSGRDAIIAFRPTGWTYRKGRPYTLWQEGRVWLYGVPYSEHSSFTELQQCVTQLRPKKIVPTVNASTPAKARAIVDLFAGAMDLRSDLSRMDAYLQRMCGADAANKAGYSALTMPSCASSSFGTVRPVVSNPDWSGKKCIPPCPDTCQGILDGAAEMVPHVDGSAQSVDIGSQPVSQATYQACGGRASNADTAGLLRETSLGKGVGHQAASAAAAEPLPTPWGILQVPKATVDEVQREHLPQSGAGMAAESSGIAHFDMAAVDVEEQRHILAAIQREHERVKRVLHDRSVGSSRKRTAVHGSKRTAVHGSRCAALDKLGDTCTGLEGAASGSAGSVDGSQSAGHAADKPDISNSRRTGATGPSNKRGQASLLSFFSRS